MRALVIAIISIAMLLPQAVMAGSDGKGGQAGAFRDLKLGGRPSAMGGAYTAVAEGGTGHLYNSAGLTQSRKYNFGFSYRIMDIDRRLGYASIAIPAKEQANLALSWVYAGSPDLESRDEQGNIIPGGEISYSENLLGVTFAKQFMPELSIGGRLFYAQSSIANIDAYTIGVDFGGLVALNMRQTFLKNALPLMRLGLAIENVGASYRWTTGDYWVTRGIDRGVSVDQDFPVNFRTGLALSKPWQYVLAADLEVNTASVVRTHFGGEYTYNRILSLRAGLDDTHPTFGAGVLKRFDSFAVRADVSYLTDRADEGDNILFSFDVIF